MGSPSQPNRSGNTRHNVCFFTMGRCVTSHSCSLQQQKSFTWFKLGEHTCATRKLQPPLFFSKQHPRQTWVHSRMPIQNNFPSIGFELLPNIRRANITRECLAVIQNLWRENYFEWAFMNGPKSDFLSYHDCEFKSCHKSRKSVHIK